VIQTYTPKYKSGALRCLVRAFITSLLVFKRNCLALRTGKGNKNFTEVAAGICMFVKKLWLGEATCEWL